MNVDELTTQFLSTLQAKVSNALYNAWFKNLQILYTEQSTVVMYIDSDFKKKKILENNSYIEIIEDTLKDVTNKDYSFELVTDMISNELVNANQDNEKNNIPIINNNINDNNVNKEEDINTEYKNINSNLIPTYTFDNYVVGESNKAAAITALEVAKNPGNTFNPFFIYGRSGIGKTHLMHAIGNYIVEHSNKTVLYVTSGQFIEDYTEMTRKANNTDNTSLIDHFKEKYRNVDVLIIDDIQMLKDANKTKDEFFKTFDILQNDHKQIIISSDTSPNDLKMFEARLQTRFNWGLTLDIKPPEVDLKVKILKNKIIGMEMASLIEDEVFDYIANNSPADVRTLEGAINRLFVYTSLYLPDKIDVEFAKQALSDFLGSNQYLTNNLAKIRKVVAEFYDVTEESIKSKKRQANINKARQVGMYLASVTTEETIERIGLEFGRDHATVLHGVAKIESELKTDKELENEIKELRDKLTE
ncbi:MAG: chromosomal replication initiator protein DnaA [Bacilli bacterium]|nr:chromosomal replication initiator protein DnaA [Bacilli bacterium]